MEIEARPIEWLTLRAAGEKMGVHPDTLRQAIHRGRLDAQKMGNTWLVNPAALDAYLASAPVGWQERRAQRLRRHTTSA